ncbi:MAG: hypothetical protein ACI9OJ_001199 [Myxococcota bacterium]|jgi:hypothetical protein
MTTNTTPIPTTDPARHLLLEAIQDALAQLTPRPTETGVVRHLVARTADGQRAMPPRARLSAEGGMPRDRWALGEAMPEQQLTVMETDVARLIANGQPLTLFGDNLFVDLDLSAQNLPIGTRLRAGEVLLRVTSEPHDGCKKFLTRFGKDALRIVANPTWRQNNYRGIYMTVEESGWLAVDDTIEVVSRP